MAEEKSVKDQIKEHEERSKYYEDLGMPNKANYYTNWANELKNNNKKRGS